MRNTRAFWLSVSVVFLLFFRARSAFTISGQYDDVCYVEWLYRFLGLAYPLTCYADFYLPGPAIGWLPAGVMGILFSKLTGTSVDAWIPVFIGITAFACWAGALWFVDKTFRIWKPNLPFYWSFAFLLSVPVLYYSTVRSCMAHSIEIFLTSLIVYLLIRKKFWAPLALSLWLAIVRVNDAPMIFVVLARAWDLRPDPLFRKRVLGAGVALAVPLLWIAFVKGYGGTDYLHRILADITPKEIFRTFFETQVGLVWSAPWWLLCLGVALWNFRTLSWMSRTSTAWMALLLLVCIGWTSSGGNLFYRYLIATYFTAFVMLWEVWPGLSARLRKAFQVLLVYQAIYLSIVTWLHNSRYQNIVDNLAASEGFGVIKTLLSPMLLVGVAPMGLSLFSWTGDKLTRWLSIPPPDYILSGPALWTLTAASVLVVGLLLTLLLKKKTPSSV